MKLLQLCHKMPFPLHDGGAYSIYSTALGLISQGADIKVLAINTPKNTIDTNEIPDDFRKKTRFDCATVDTRIKPLKAFVNLFSDQSYFVERFWSDDWNDHLIKLLRNEEFDIIQLEHLYMCLYLKTIRQFSKAKVILRPQNVENIVWRRVLENKINPLKTKYLRIATNRLFAFEMQMARQVDGIMAISREDADIFNAYSPGTPLITVPVGFDFTRIKYYNYDKKFDNFPVFYHLGSMDWMPNQQGLRWFIEEVIPFVRNEYPGFIFRIAGKKMPAWFFKKNDKNLIVDGTVEDSLKYQEDKTVMIVPLLSGGGLRVKIIEGMALGKTIISTTIGAEGIPYTDQENILIADTKEDFAIQIKKCRESREFCQKIGTSAQKFAVENYDLKETGKRMIQFYNDFT
jgi:polysaccharide biosynthesis protein PslH